MRHRQPCVPPPFFQQFQHKQMPKVHSISITYELEPEYKEQQAAKVPFKCETVTSASGASQ